MIDKDTYLSHYKTFESEAASAPGWVATIRKTGIDRFAELGFPTPKNESWRFTRLRPLLQHEFRVKHAPSPNGVSSEQLVGLSFDDSELQRLVFINGAFSEALSAFSPQRGVTIKSIRSALREDSDRVRKHLAKHADTTTSPFAALNTAYLLDGAFIHIEKDVCAEQPIHLLFVSTTSGEEAMSQPRNLIVADELSQAKIIESYVGGSKGVYFTNAVSEIVVGAGANIEHYKIQKESREAYHVGSLHAHVGRDARFATESVSIGGALVRNDVVTVLDGEGIDCRMDGLYMADGRQHVDNHTNIEHAKPHCESHELYKGILNGRARGVFNGKIHVHPDAQKTDAKQSNGAMLLSDEAQINTNPQLEIYADDVKCTHGATVGQIDDNAVFYLQSRGIKDIDARHMLVYAFANEVLERITVSPLRERMSADLFDWLSSAQLTP